MRTLEHRTQLCVVGGGMAGLCCALAAARNGIRVVLIQDRPVLGGNASSEIRMWIGGAQGKDNREGGIIEELMLENFYQNPGLKYPLWDAALYGKAVEEKRLTLLLNTACFDAQCHRDRILSVKAWQANAETFHLVYADYFADCSGDSVLAPLSGAAFRYGREAKSDFGETIPPDVGDNKTMGMSCLFQIRETPGPVPFHPPAWAYRYPTDADLPYKDHDKNNNFWWIELGGEWDCLHDTDRCREELIKICYGVWDHMKNCGDHGVENWELEWLGFLPGKRESRRYVGRCTVTQNHVEAGGPFPDVVAHAGWSMDDHFPQGFYYTLGHPTVYHKAPSPWGLPLGCMISQNVKNLVFAGRNVSVSHAALSSCRVMATCAVLGQALGTAVAMALTAGCPVERLDIPALQQTLMDQDQFIPGLTRQVSALSRQARCSAPVVCNGRDRGEENLWVGQMGDSITYIFPRDTPIRRIRLVFDNDMNRKFHNMPCNYPLVQTRFYLPRTLITAYRLEGMDSAGNQRVLEVPENHQRLVFHHVDWCVSSLRLVPLATNGEPTLRVFGFEVQ